MPQTTDAHDRVRDVADDAAYKGEAAADNHELGVEPPAPPHVLGVIAGDSPDAGSLDDPTSFEVADRTVSETPDAGAAFVVDRSEPNVRVPVDEAVMGYPFEEVLPDPAGHVAEQHYFDGWNGAQEHGIAAGLATGVEHDAYADLEIRPEADADGDTPYDTHLSGGPPLEIAGVEEQDDDAQDLTDKHDALAEAVQSALFSVYGELPAAASGARDGSVLGSPFEMAGHLEDAPVSRAAHGPDVTVDDGLTPQDVILNYFDYRPAEADGVKPSRFKVFDVPSQEDTNVPSFERRFKSSYGNVENVPSAERPFARVIDKTPVPPEREIARYEPAAPAFPVPVAPAAFDQSRQVQRDSGRLLGAAGIGLVGGIAIAATLAVLAINSYGPVPSRTNQESNNQPFGNEGGPDEGGRELASGVKSGTEPPVGEILAADVSGSGAQPIPLALQARSARSLDQTLVSVNGIPQGGRLTAGIDAGGGVWLLPPQRLRGLALTVPSDSPDVIPLDVQLLEGNARIPLSEKRTFVVRVSRETPVPLTIARAAMGDTGPLASSNEFTAAGSRSPAGSFDTQTLVTGSKAPEGAEPAPFKTETVAGLPRTEPQTSPRTRTQGEPSTQLALVGPPVLRPMQLPEIEDLIREGNKRMREGDILQARDFYLKAINMGDADAALAMGRSYDPIYFARLDKKNADADPAKAFDWYRRAMDGGAVQTAKVRIENLKHFMSE